jgi:hypothetical protein
VYSQLPKPQASQICPTLWNSELFSNLRPCIDEACSRFERHQLMCDPNFMEF